MFKWDIYSKEDAPPGGTLSYASRSKLATGSFSSVKEASSEHCLDSLHICTYCAQAHT